MFKILILVQLVLLFFCNKLVAVDLIPQNSDYVKFLETNIASFADLFYERIMCPEDLSLLYRPDLLSSCNERSQHKKYSDPSINKGEYLEQATKYSTWMPTFSIDEDLPALEDYWPFNQQKLEYNQKLLLLGITGENVKTNLKTNFYNTMKVIQNATLPVNPDKVELLFDDDDMAHVLDVWAGLLNASMIANRTHITSPKRQKELKKEIWEAFELIKTINKKHYEAITKIDAVITPFEVDEERDINVAGSFANIIGLTWINPNVEWTRTLLAENLVHEHTHNALYLAEMVHGTVTDREQSDEVKTTSAIRQEARPFSKSLHAAYVSVGLCAWHLHALQTPNIPHEEHEARLLDLYSTLPSAVEELTEIQAITHVMTPGGEAILKHMSDYLKLLEKHVETIKAKQNQEKQTHNDEL